MASSENLATRVSETLGAGLVIPAHPLALTSARKLDERRQRALSRYYIAAGAGGLAVGVHTTQFEIRDPSVGLLRPVLELAAEEMAAKGDLVGVAGICGETAQAVAEAELARELGYHAGLLSLSACPAADEDGLIAHCLAVAEVIPLFGFYLQASIGGRVLPYSFWRRFCEIENVVAIKMAPFNRYQTLDVVRAVVDAGRDDIALYTGNDDNIIADLLTPFSFERDGKKIERRVVGGLLGHWAVWTRRAVEIFDEIRALEAGADLSPYLQLNAEVTDCNAALFDVANGFRGCIPGVQEILRRNGLLDGLWCLDESLALSAGQAEELDRVSAAYPHLLDDDFVEKHRGGWLN